MTEVERLNYVNGRRLQAGDFQLEQDYLVEMRRRLNHGLFTPGVVNGCGVRQVQGTTTQVEIDCGLALDPKGREMVLTRTVTLDVPSRPPVTGLNGYFLVMSYAEERLAGEDPDCGPPIREAARVREQPELHWTETLPAHALCGMSAGSPLDCGVVLALVSLKDCEITVVDTTLRQLANPTHSSQATAYALEGEKDIDPANPKILHFQVRGGSPSAVTLYLWAGEFSSLHYTEVGAHGHTLESVSLTPTTTDLGNHTHDLANHAHGLGNHVHGVSGLQGLGDHGHRIKLNWGESWKRGFRIATTDTPWTEEIFGNATTKGFWYREAPTNHPSDENSPPASPSFLERFAGLDVTGKTTDAATTNTDPPVVGQNTTGIPSQTTSTQSHSHALQTPAAVTSVGSTGLAVRGGAAYAYFTALKIKLDGEPITTEILRGLPSFHGLIGSGDSGHDLVQVGTGAIDLLDVGRAVGKPLDEGSHTLLFYLEPPPAAQPGDPPARPNGGKLLYNLFVE